MIFEKGKRGAAKPKMNPLGRNGPLYKSLGHPLNLIQCPFMPNKRATK